MNLKFLFFAFHILIWAFSFGQERRCDLRVEITYPDSNHTFYSPSRDSVKIAIINQGPDSLIASDMLSIKLTFGGPVLFPDFVQLNKTLRRGEQFNFTKGLKIDYEGNVDGFRMCMEVYAWSPDPNRLLRNEKDFSYSDNIACIYPNHRDSTFVSSRKHQIEQQLTIYPNPTSSSVNFKSHSSHDINAIQMWSQHGQLVVELEGLTGQKQELDISNLRPGVYSVIVLTDGKMFSTKIIVLPDRS